MVALQGVLVYFAASRTVNRRFVHHHRPYIHAALLSTARNSRTSVRRTRESK